MLLFRDEEHVANWAGRRDLPVGAVIPPDQGWRLAHEWYQDKLAPNWRRHTLEEAEEALSRIGLTGPFWSLRG